MNMGFVMGFLTLSIKCVDVVTGWESLCQLIGVSLS